jgi:hypothetical protein
MSLQNLVRLSQIKKKSLSDYAHVNKVSKKKMTISVIQDDDREQVQQQRKGDAIFTHL